MSQSMAKMSDTSLPGRPYELSTTATVTKLDDGLAAAPMLANVMVTLQVHFKQAKRYAIMYNIAS